MPREPGSRYFRVSDREWKDAADGVRYAQFSTAPDDPERPLVVLSHLPPGHVEPPHTHGCNYLEIVIEGTLTVGKADPMGSGDVRATQAGVGYGPLTAGPDGCLRLTIFEKAGGSMMRRLGALAGEVAE